MGNDMSDSKVDIDNRKKRRVDLDATIIAKMYRKGYSINYIADALKTSNRTIRKRLGDVGLKAAMGRPPAKQNIKTALAISKRTKELTRHIVDVFIEMEKNLSDYNTIIDIHKNKYHLQIETQKKIIAYHEADKSNWDTEQKMEQWKLLNKLMHDYVNTFIYGEQNIMKTWLNALNKKDKALSQIATLDTYFQTLSNFKWIMQVTLTEIGKESPELRKRIMMRFNTILTTHGRVTKDSEFLTEPETIEDALVVSSESTNG